MIYDGIAPVHYPVLDRMGNAIEYEKTNISLFQLSEMLGNPALWDISGLSLHFDGPNLVLTWYDGIGKRGNWVIVNEITKEGNQHGDEQAAPRRGYGAGPGGDGAGSGGGNRGECGDGTGSGRGDRGDGTGHGDSGSEGV